jgi:hypothetical protein
VQKKLKLINKNQSIKYDILNTYLKGSPAESFSQLGATLAAWRQRVNGES